MNEQKTLLIIEDNKHTRNILESKFEKEGYKVETAVNGEIGFTKALEIKPALVILDLILPKMNGVEVLKKIRADEDWGRTAKILVLSNLTYLGDSIEELENKVQDHMVKTNVQLDEIIVKVNELI